MMRRFVMAEHIRSRWAAPGACNIIARESPPKSLGRITDHLGPEKLMRRTGGCLQRVESGRQYSFRLLGCSPNGTRPDAF